MILRAFLDGIKRTVSAPAVLLGVMLVTMAMALPLALTLRGMLEGHLGTSLAAHDAAEGVNHDWWQEFQAQAAGLGTTFTPSVIGFAAVLDNISSVLDAEREIAPVTGALGAYLLVWTFLSGGIVDRFARRRPTRAHGFFAASGVFFFRFLRLAVAAGLVYWFLFGVVHGWLFDDLYRDVTREVNVERAAFAWRAALYLVFGALLVLANVLFDYARIRAVVEDRRSMIVTLLASARFVVRHPRLVFGLYALNALAFLALLALWAVLAPGAGRAGLSMWLGIGLAQAYLAARLFLKLHFIASQTALFQATLAHAGYTAAPAAVWPESPSAEAIHA
ncbi:MAG: hypothetical protein ACRD26_22675 [Vicinamibacterales bacterium]